MRVDVLCSKVVTTPGPQKPVSPSVPYGHPHCPQKASWMEGHLLTIWFTKADPSARLCLSIWVCPGGTGTRDAVCEPQPLFISRRNSFPQSLANIKAVPVPCLFPEGLTWGQMSCP